MNDVVYKYVWGSEDGSYHIEVIKMDNDFYKIIMEQVIMYGEPYKLFTSHQIISEENIIEKEVVNDELFFNKYITNLHIKAVCNPPPESLFYYK